VGSGIEFNPPNGTSEFVWTAADVPTGTSMLFYMTDAMNRKGGVSDLMTSHATGNRLCLNSTSPTTTAVIASASATLRPKASPVSRPKKLSAGAISGIAVGGVIGLAGFVALVHFRLWKRKFWTTPSETNLIDIDESFNEDPDLLSRLDPFPPPNPQFGGSDASSQDWARLASLSSDFTHSPTTETQTVDASSVAVAASSVAVALHPPTSSSRARARARKGNTTSAGAAVTSMQFIVHTDAEDVIDEAREDEVEVVELPPRYINGRQTSFLSVTSDDSHSPLPS